MNKEYRKFNTEFDVEKNKVVGYASIFNSESRDLGFIETISTGAFDGRLEDDTIMLFNHDEDKVLARNTSGTLTLSIDERGLKYEFDIPETSYGNDLKVLMERGDIYESSFAFTVPKGGDEWEERDGKFYRTINEVEYLYDTSVVTRGAYANTDASLRSFENAKKELMEKRENATDINNTTGIDANTLRLYNETIKLKAA